MHFMCPQGRECVFLTIHFGYKIGIHDEHSSLKLVYVLQKGNRGIPEVLADLFLAYLQIEDRRAFHLFTFLSGEGIYDIVNMLLCLRKLHTKSMRCFK